MDGASGSARREQIPEDTRRFFEDLGRDVAGPLLCGMIQWSVDRIRENRPDALLFFSRDGKILHQLWQSLCPDDLKHIPTRYVLASRRCLRMARMQELDADTLDFLTSHTRNLNVEGLLGRIGLERGDYINVLSRFDGIELETSCALVSPESLRKLFKDLEDILLQRAQKEGSAYRKYLESLEIQEFSRMAVFDIGWHGSLQYALLRLLQPMNPEVSLDGYYCGLFPDARRYRSTINRMEGYLLDNGQTSRRHLQIERFVELLEFFFSAKEPGFLYCKEDGRGQPMAVFAAEDRDSHQTRALDALQHGILDSVHREFSSVEEIYENIRRLGLEPTAREAKHLGRFRASRSFGNPEGGQPFADPGRFLSNFLFWRDFVARYKDALWRPGFWAQLSYPERLLLRRLSPKGTRPFRSGD